MTTFTLTTGTDPIVGTGADDTVNGTSATLNPADSLDGGGGHDTLALFGSGTFDLSTLAQFDGFEQVDVTNITGGASNLVLRDGVDLTVNIENEADGGGTVQLASGAVTLDLGGSDRYAVNFSTGAATIDSAGNSNNFFLSTGDATINITGSGSDNRIYVSSGEASVDISQGNTNFVIITNVSQIGYDDVFAGKTTLGGGHLYAEGSGGELDLTQLTINNKWSLHIGGWSGSSNVTVDVDSSTLSHFNQIEGRTNEKVQTAATTRDLTGTSVIGEVTIASTNATGT